MNNILDLLRGFPGHPSHPPLTDASIGAYTVGVAMLILGAAGVEKVAMAHGALLAISGGLIVALPTALTGLLDEWPVPPDDLRGAAHRLRWYRWDVGEPETGWALRLAVEDAERGRAWALSAVDAAL